MYPLILQILSMSNMHWHTHTHTVIPFPLNCIYVPLLFLSAVVCCAYFPCPASRNTRSNLIQTYLFLRQCWFPWSPWPKDLRPFAGDPVFFSSMPFYRLLLMWFARYPSSSKLMCFVWCCAFSLHETTSSCSCNFNVNPHLFLPFGIVRSPFRLSHGPIDLILR